LAFLIGLNLWGLARNPFGYRPGALLATAIAVVGLDVVAVGLMPSVMRPSGTRWNVAFRLQIYVVLMALPVAFAGYVSQAVLSVLVLLTIVSLSVLEWAPKILSWIAFAILNSAVSMVKTGQGSNTDPGAEHTGRPLQ